MSFPQDYLYVLSKRKKLAVAIFICVIAATVCLILFLPRQYTADTTLVLDNETPIGAQGAALQDLVGTPSGPSPETQLEVVTARPCLERVIHELGLNMRTEDLDKRVYAMHPKQTDVIKVFATGDTAQQSADIANTLVKAYIEDLKARHDREGDETANDVNRRIVEVERNLNAKEDEIMHWLEAHKVGLPEPEAEGKIEQLSDLHSMLAQGRGDQVHAETAWASLGKDLASLRPKIPLTETYASSPVVEGLQTHLFDLQEQRAQALFDFKPNQPEVKALDVQIAQTQSDLRLALSKSIQDGLLKKETVTQTNPVRLDMIEKVAQARAEFVGARARVVALNKEEPKLQAQINGFAAQSRELGELQREREALATVWGNMLAKYEDIKVQQYASALRPQVVEPAVPPIRMSQPRPVLYSVVGFLLACILSITACVAMERVDKRVVTVRDANRLLGVPALGAYPRALPRQEADRLWARLSLAGAGDEWHVLAVVPTQSGATETARAVASAAKRQGHSVILVVPPDGTGNQVSARLTDADIKPDVMTARTAGDLAESVGAWRANGDLVILDLPPVHDSPVGGSAARLADRVLLDVQRGADSEVVTEETTSALAGAHLEIVGAALFSGSVTEVAG